MFSLKRIKQFIFKRPDLNFTQKNLPWIQATQRGELQRWKEREKLLLHRIQEDKSAQSIIEQLGYHLEQRAQWF